MSGNDGNVEKLVLRAGAVIGYRTQPYTIELAVKCCQIRRGINGKVVRNYGAVEEGTRPGGARVIRLDTLVTARIAVVSFIAQMLRYQ